MAASSTSDDRTVSDQILDYLVLEGATKIFGLPGAGIAHLLQRLRARPEFSYVVCRQESGAAYMADGYFRATGKPGVVLVTSGPGATNALTGTMNANFGGSAVLALTGEVPQNFLGRGYLQEGTDCGLNIRDIYAAGTRYSADIGAAAGAPILIEQALRDMLSIPCRAVRLGISDNVASLPVADSISPRPPTSAATYRSVPDSAPVNGARRALEVLSSAKRPLILLGNGCRAALRDEATAKGFECLVEWWQIPVITTSDGKGVFPETHDLSLRSYGFAGSEWPQYWMVGQNGAPAHDALLVIGSSLGELATYRWNPMLVPNGPFIQVDIDQSMIGRGFPLTEGIVAEAGAFLRTMWDQAAAWPRNQVEVEARGAEISEIKKSHSAFASDNDYNSEAAPLQPAALCRVLNGLLPDDALVFIDSGNCVGWGLHCLTIGRRQELHVSLAMGAMGLGVCAVVGARLGRPDRLAVALVGDGAFLMHVAEVSTAAAHNVGAIWLVLLDDDLRMVTQGMEKFFPIDRGYEGAYSLGQPDLGMVAEGLGADAFRVYVPEDLQRIWPAVLAGAENGKPQVIVAHVDPKAAPPYWSTPYWQPNVD
ncbi:thiamine pyrophosphate-binding protein [Ferirhizobium litorale]|uniref:Thiamine pyrophosphate-binding protein n=2 Tax=Ferirhizobium litorale TaxID=2927786 RepID=A0AAE3TZS5_9HYPH|nr:thiamine pyrophosphate-binding protein [Fererhizobium litorale]MDI7921324.1 thiamine pyrophosphate-binding protein [Fererhizobium litorale]